MTNAQQIVDDWNARHPVGTLVDVYNLRAPRADLRCRTRTRHKATVLGKDQPVAWLEGVIGAWALDAIEVVEVGE